MVLRMVRGDRKEFLFSFFYEDGTEITISDASNAKFTAAWPKTRDQVFQKTLGSGITLEGANSLSVAIQPADTSSVTPQKKGDIVLRFDIELSWADGRVLTPARGWLVVEEDIS